MAPIGRALSHYRILEKLGEGGMGQVYLAEDTVLERRVALKVLPPGVAADAEQLERFQREVRAVAAINHPGIVAVYAVGEAEGLHFFAMEHVIGKSLAECIPERGYPLDELLALALPLVRAVEAAHGAGVVHRDLKPGNVMIGDGQGVKVLDFGLAKRVDGGSAGDRTLTQAGALVGTIAYMAPEQIRGEGADERTDLFALGVLLYEMATGRHPFDSGSVARTVVSILHDRPRPPSAIKPSLGAGLDPILARCLEKEPGQRYPRAAALRKGLEDLLEAASRATMTLPVSPEGRLERRSSSRPGVWRVARSRNRNFSGGDGEVEQLRTLVSCQGRGVALVALVGLGGVGKTELAVEFTYRFAGDYEIVWWLPADEPAGLGGRFAALGRELGLEPRRDMERTVTEVRDRLSQESGWLLVFDNAEEASAIRPYLPSEGDGHVLVTSRNPAWRGLGEVFELSVWGPDRTAAYLHRRTGDSDERAAHRLADALGGLPLAVEHAAAYIETSGQSVDSYVRLFGEHSSRLLSKVDPGSDSAAPVTATWDLSLRRLARDSPAAEQLLDLCAFLAPDDVPLDLLSGAGELLPEPLGSVVGDELELDRAIAALLHYSLVSRLEDSLSIHRLVQAAVRGALAESGADWLERAVRMVAAAFPKGGNLDVQIWPRCARLLPHALSCVGRMGAEAPRVTADLLGAVGSYLQGRAQFEEARSSLQRALEIEEARSGRRHPRVAIRLNSLGRLAMSTGDVDAARSYFERALVIEEAELGPDHPNVAKRLSNIGAVLNELDRPEEARPLLQRALEISEAALGPDHVDVAARLANLAVSHSLTARKAAPEDRQTSWQAARTHMDRARSIYRQVLGADHVLVAKMTMNIGSLLIDQGDLKAAKRWLEEALALTEANLGPDHPETALCLKNLGEVHQAVGDIEAARHCFHRALAIGQEAFAGRHREQGLTYEHLGLLAREEGRGEEARLCFERALQTLEATVGADHTDTARVRERLAGAGGRPEPGG